MADFPDQQLVGFATHRLGTFATTSASGGKHERRGCFAMLGKLAGAWIGEKLAGENRGGRGAIMGFAAAAAAKRIVPLAAGAALGAWAFRKWREKRRSHATFPPDAAPRVPASETRSPS
jgi:hypothetical protein